jgi:cytochrome c oxidase subunit II
LKFPQFQPASKTVKTGAMPLPGMWRLTCLATLGLLSGGCAPGNSPNALDPRSPAAAALADLWWLMFWLAMAVFGVVMGLALFAVYRSRRRQPDDPEPFVTRHSFLLIAGVIVPAIILLVLLVATARVGRALWTPPATEMLTVEVIGRQWWWEVRYPDHGVVTANEIHIPMEEPIQFRFTSGDVIHSFWVPQLHGKIDLMDGKTTTLHLTEPEPGIYRGQCAEFCGLQHALMALFVVVQPAEEFDAWIEQQQQPAVDPDELLLRQGQGIFFGAECAHCHRIQGVTPELVATGMIGPDLTHLASRQTLAAGTVDNTEENLARWILDPHSIKPGVHMPPTPLTEVELEALLAYLMSLE